MNENTNKHLDHFIDKVMKSSTLETPSFDFTSKVMSQITATSKNTVTIYKPLFSKTAWGILILLTAGIVGFSVFSKDNTTLGWLDQLDFSRVSNVFSGIKISQTAMYSLMMFAVMLFIQIPLLKHYFNKRFDV
ncbi:MAG TPA: hypothetical protein VGA80_06495 [Flavobacteriaceae bacterium]|jgi:hypothetical protein